jgi:hypothetical protein
MWRETNLLGVYISPLVAYMTAAVIIFVPLRMILARPLRWTWNTSLAEAGIFLCILGALVTYL